MSINNNFQENFQQFKMKQSKSTSWFQTASVGNSSNSNLNEDQETLLGSWNTRLTATYNDWTNTNPDQDCFQLSSFQRYLVFFVLMGMAALFMLISLFSLPMLLISPHKFASTFTTSSLLFILAFMFLNGWKYQLKNLFCWDRAVFTGSYWGSIVGTLYFSMVRPMYVPVVLCVLVQIVALGWYLASYLPGGTNGLKWMTRSILPI